MLLDIGTKYKPLLRTDRFSKSMMSSVGNGSLTVDCCKAVSGHCSTQVFQFPPQSMMYPVTVESLGKNLMTDYFQRFCEKLVINSSQIQSHNQPSTSEVSWHQKSKSYCLWRTIDRM